MIGVVVFGRLGSRGEAPQLRPASPAALTLANPGTVLAFVAVLASAGLHPDELTGPGWWFLMLGTALGAATWWALLPIATWASRMNERPRFVAYLAHGATITGALVSLSLFVSGGLPLLRSLL